MALRLVIGLVKGLIVGGLLGFALAKIGLAAPGALIAYLAAAAAGALVGLIAGKPIWAEGARIEAGLKAAQRPMRPDPNCAATLPAAAKTAIPAATTSSTARSTSA